MIRQRGKQIKLNIEEMHKDGYTDFVLFKHKKDLIRFVNNYCGAFQ